MSETMAIWDERDDVADTQPPLDVGPTFLLSRLVASAAERCEVRRAWMVVDWSVRESTPAWLDLAKLHDHAAALRALAPIVDTASAHAANGALRSLVGIDEAHASARAENWEKTSNALREWALVIAR